MTTSSSRLDLSSPVLVLGATGTVGGAVVAELVERGARVRALVRGHHRPDLPPAVEQVIGDLADRAALDSAMTDVRTAFYVSPHDAAEVQLAETVIAAAAAAGTRIVFAGVHVPSRPVRSWVQLQLFKRLMPHYRPKLRIGQLLAAAPDSVVFAVANFYQNDEIFLPDILAGRYPMPLRGVNRVDVDDIAVAVARALLEPDFPAGEYMVSGPESLTGNQVAGVWANALGRPVRYIGNDEAAVDAVVRDRLSGRKQIDFLATVRVLRRFSAPTKERDVAATADLLGYRPRRYADYVAELVSGLPALARDTPPGTGTDVQDAEGVELKTRAA